MFIYARKKNRPTIMRPCQRVHQVPLNESRFRRRQPSRLPAIQTIGTMVRLTATQTIGTMVRLTATQTIDTMVRLTATQTIGTMVRLTATQTIGTMARLTATQTIVTMVRLVRLSNNGVYFAADEITISH